MDCKNIKIIKGSQLLTKGYKNDAGFDVYSNTDICVVEPSGIATVKTGIAIDMRGMNIFAYLTARSSVASKGIMVSNAIIDQGYTGEIHMIIYNFSNEKIKIMKGDRLASLVFFTQPCVNIKNVKILKDGNRGDKGLGSTNLGK